MTSRSVALAHSPFQSRADGAQVHTHAQVHGRSSGFPLVQHRRQYQGAMGAVSMVLVGAIGKGSVNYSRGGLPCRLYDNIVLCHNSNMSASRKRASRVFTISFPADLADQVTAVAEEESRNISELFREAFRTYRLDRIHLKLERFRAEAAARSPVKYTEDDVEALVDEIRAENFAKPKTAEGAAKKGSRGVRK